MLFISLNTADIDQLKRIMEIVGTPSSELLKKISSEHVSSVIWLSSILFSNWHHVSLMVLHRSSDLEMSKH